MTNQHCTCPNASYGIKHSYGCLEGQIERLQRELKNLAPIGRYNGHDIEWWYQSAERLRGALRHLLSHADRPRKELLWCSSAVEEADQALAGAPVEPEVPRRHAQWCNIGRVGEDGLWMACNCRVSENR